MTQEEFFKRYVYDVVADRIGGGGFGTVYKAYDSLLHRDVAIKVSEVKTTADGKKSFSLKDEFEALSHVPKHPNIANYEELYSFKMPNGIFDYAVMQYYPDGNLTQAIKQGLSDEQKDEIATQLLEGIDFLHKHKVVHRDLKPGNILITRHGGHVIPLITDFGLSKAANTGDGSRFSNSFGGGTQRYSSPEQLKGEPLRFNTDLWSFGAVVYELFTGEALFSPGSGASNSAQAELEVYHKIVQGDVQSLAKMPERWRKVAERCMVVDPEKRVKNAEELLFLLNGYAEATEVEEVADTKTQSQPPTQTQPTPIPPITPKTPINPTIPTPTPAEQKTPVPPKAETPSGSGKTNKGLVVSLAFALAIVVGLLLFMLMKPEPVVIDEDTEAFQACQTVNDYRGYLSYYGRGAKHYREADSIVKRYVADSLAELQERLAQQQAKEKADAETKAKADAEKREDEAYKKCVTIADCDSYLKTYPNGRYVTEVSTKRAELVQQQVIARAEADAKARLEAQKKEEAAFKGCTTIAACDKYLKEYPNGQYVDEVRALRSELVERSKKQDFTETAGGLNIRMVYVKGGTFTMGCTSEQSDCEDREKPTHQVTLSDYYIGKYEVTVGEFRRFVEETGYKTDAEKEGWAYRWMQVDGKWQWNKVNGVNWRCGTNGEVRSALEDNHPVIYVSWNDAVAYCNWLKKKTGKAYCLPTEAQWEFAARGGNNRRGYKYAGSNAIENVAWYGNSNNAGGVTHPVGQKNSNELGIYDMSGNALEWCNDWYGSYGEGSQTDPKGPSSGQYRELRGGSWYNGARNCRVSYRDDSDPDHRGSGNGFRLALIQ